ncbi:MFS transporter [Microbacterium sp. ISL-59]|uniref:MFS transporter n=1 Tax=Microbacterium sp. ISL-59 TaxID=2819159 RepID=UPI001BE97068|nr:MFS transporter [Microbacterium sp. ISL-59]MBT2495787.1 MFS transporter [Microbacterium sp. ISL-59]
MFTVGIVSQVVFSATFLGLPAASVLVQDSLDLSTAGLALVLGGASIAVVLSEFPWGVAADRFGERRVLLIGVVGSATVLAVIAVIASLTRPSAWGLAGLLFLAAGMGGAVTGPSGSALLGWFPAHRHGTLLSLRVAAVPAGGAVGTLAYSWLLGQSGVGLTFAAFAGACALCAVLVWVFVFDPPTVALTGGASVSRSARPALRRIGVWRVAASGLLLDVSQFFVLTFAAAILADQHGYPPIAGVAAVAAMQLVGGALRVVAGIGTDFVQWMSRTTVVRTMAVVQAGCLVVVACGQSVPLYVSLSAMILAGVASCAWQGAHFAQIATIAGPGQAGTALGLNNTATSLGAFIPQVGAGALALVVGWGSATIFLGVIPAALAVFLFPRASVDPQSGGPTG